MLGAVEVFGGEDEGENGEAVANSRRRAGRARRRPRKRASAEGDPANGKTLFVSADCGGCHAFEDAGTSGTVGPNLDEAQPSFEAAAAQIANGGGGMPAFEGQLSEQEIADVAAYVSGGG